MGHLIDDGTVKYLIEFQQSFYTFFFIFNINVTVWCHFNSSLVVYFHSNQIFIDYSRYFSLILSKLQYSGVFLVVLLAFIKFFYWRSQVRSYPIHKVASLLNKKQFFSSYYCQNYSIVSFCQLFFYHYCWYYLKSINHTNFYKSFKTLVRFHESFYHNCIRTSHQVVNELLF